MSNRAFITGRLQEALEEVTGQRMAFPSRENPAAFLGDSFSAFVGEAQGLLDLSDDTIFDSASTFHELVVLLEHELF